MGFHVVRGEEDAWDFMVSGRGKPHELYGTGRRRTHGISQCRGEEDAWNFTVSGRRGALQWAYYMGTLQRLHERDNCPIGDVDFKFGNAILFLWP